MRNLEQYAFECMRELDAIGIEYGIVTEFVVNTRAKSRWGQCCVVPNGYSININIALLDEESSINGLKEVIIHELLHTCDGCMNHGKKWKMLASKVNGVYGYNVKRAQSASEIGVSPEYERLINARREESIKYVIVCTECGKKYRRKRMCGVVKNPENYACGYCGGSLRVV